MQEVAFPRRKGRFDPSLLLVLLLLPGIPLAEGDCQFPVSWTGEWISEHQEKPINTTHFGNEECRQKLKDDEFIVFQPLDKCYRCIIINERHENFLHIREGNCLQTISDTICTEFKTDDPLFSMYRKNAKPMPCPFNGFLFTFSYNIGGNQCLMHPSSAEKCIDESKIILKYQSCPDVPKTESQVEELQCLAMWVESGKKFFVGTVMKKTDIEKVYRCFLYEEKKENHMGKVLYSIAQSGDDTCSGLSDTNQGSANMNFTRVDREQEKCKYPHWVTTHHEWHSLDDKRIYHFTGKNATLKIKSHDTNIQEERILCHNSVPVDSNINKQGHKFKFVAHITTGCDIAYVCMMFHQRDYHIIEVQQSSQKVNTAEEACSSIDFSTVPYTTLITYNKSNNLHQRKCQHPGRYETLENPRRERRSKKLSRLVRRRTWPDDSSDNNCSSTRIQIGCSSSDPNEMIIANTCPNSNEIKYSCHGSWEEQGVTYTIVSEKIADRKPGRAMCFSMRFREDSDILSDGFNGPEQWEQELLFSKPSNVCLRHNSKDSVYRIEKKGGCEDATPQASSGASSIASFDLLLLLLLFKIGTTTLYKLLLSS